MKKLIFFLELFFLANILFAQNWLLGVDLLFTHDRSNLSRPDSPDFTLFTSELYFGRYLLKNTAIGGEIGYYCLNFTHNSFKFGPFIEYEFLKSPYLSLGIKPSLGYHLYSNSILNEFSGSSIDFDFDLLFNFFLTKKITIFTSLMGARFQYQWWNDTDSGTKTNYSRTVINIDGWLVLSNLKLGLKFKF